MSYKPYHDRAYLITLPITSNYQPCRPTTVGAKASPGWRAYRREYVVITGEGKGTTFHGNWTSAAAARRSAATYSGGTVRRVAPYLYQPAFGRIDPSADGWESWDFEFDSAAAELAGQSDRQRVDLARAQRVERDPLTGMETDGPIYSMAAYLRQYPVTVAR